MQVIIIFCLLIIKLADISVDFLYFPVGLFEFLNQPLFCPLSCFVNTIHEMELNKITIVSIEATIILDNFIFLVLRLYYIYL